jgi:hypothetical protein
MGEIKDLDKLKGFFSNSEEVDNWSGGNYSWFHMEINLLGSTRKEFQNHGDQAEGFQTLMHEYTHYIQNFTTSFGYTTFNTYIDCIQALRMNNLELKRNPKLPLKGGLADEKMSPKNLFNAFKIPYVGVLRRRNVPVYKRAINGNFEIWPSTEYVDYWSKEVTMAKITVNNYILPVSEFVLRESMAFMSNYLSTKCSMRIKEKHIFHCPYGLEYKGIYLFIKNFLPQNDCFKLTYVLCESALMIPPYTEKMCIMLNYLKNNHVYLSSQSDVLILSTLLNSIRFKESLPIVINTGINLLNEKLETYSKHEDNDGFLAISKRISNVIIDGLNSRLKSNSFYQDYMDMNYLNDLSSKFKSPIIRFKDGDTTVLCEEDDQFSNDLIIFSGILRAIRTMYEKKPCACPFSEKNSLCSLKKKWACRNYYPWMHNRKGYHGCLMDSAMEVTGVRRRDRNSFFSIFQF